MAIVVGIDEAGYGPILGPLVVSSAAFRVPDGKVDADLWDELEAAVCRRAGHDGRIAVDDSKALLARKGGFAHLEEATLAFLRLAGCDGASLRMLAAGLDGERDSAWDAYPWHRGQDVPLPCVADGRRVAVVAGKLSNGLDSASVEFLGAEAKALHVAEYNALVKKWDNKSMATSLIVMDYIARAWEGYPEKRLRVCVDKLGGRNAYAPWLMAVCRGGTVTVVEEGAARSAYEVTNGARRMAVSFEPRSDSRHLPVALASMLSKYLRELFMRMLNDFWLQRHPGLRPTAGYYTDGRRFLEDLEARGAVDDAALRLMLRVR